MIVENNELEPDMNEKRKEQRYIYELESGNINNDEDSNNKILRQSDN